MAEIHFWLPRDVPPELGDWDPDLEPNRFVSILWLAVELYQRLAAGGVEVSIGASVPADTQLLVILAKSARNEFLFYKALRAIRKARGRFLLVWMDNLPPLYREFPVRPLVELMPNQAAIRHPWQLWIPELPQRGLRPRLAERRGAIRSLAFKGYAVNVHPDLRTEEWRAALARRGLCWWLDVPETGESDQAWHDYTGVDASICIRNPAQRHLVAGKPAGKLINAWLAGCIPLAEKEPAYLELGNDGSDVFFVNSVWDCLRVVEDLNRDPGHLAEVERRIDDRAREFAPEVVLELWRDLLVELAARPGPNLWLKLGRSTALLGAQLELDRTRTLRRVVASVRFRATRARAHLRGLKSAR